MSVLELALALLGISIVAQKKDRHPGTDPIENCDS